MLQKKRFGEIIGNNVKKIRTAKGMSQESLAHECGFYRTYINLVESNRRLPSSFSLYKLARGLGVSVEELYPKSK
jgi:transcriptional regulator with XRE-family HTH domain